MTRQNPEKEPRSRPMWRNYIPHAVIFTLVYFALSILALNAQNIDLVTAVLGSFVMYLIMTAIVVIAYRLWKTEQAQNYNLLTRMFLGSPKEPAPDPSLTNDGEEDATATQDAFRKNARIEAMKREAERMRDRVLRLGATISIALVLFWVLMNTLFGLSPEELYFLPWPALAVLWFSGIVFLPRWMTYVFFLTCVGMSFGLQTFGPGIIMMLPNFIMLPLFYLLMMVFMFGSIMLPNLMQIKYFKPGDGTWEVPKGSMRGQFAANAMIETQIDRFVRFAKGLSDRRSTRGMVFSGPPGTGKTLKAKEIATELTLPFVLADASAFNAPFMGFGQLIPLIVRNKTEGLCKEYGGAIVFIDEGETLFGARSGMQQPGAGGMGSGFRELDEFDVVDIMGRSSCQAIDVPHVRTRQWNEQQMAATKPAPPHNGKDSMFMMPGAGGGSSAIYPFLTWMSGADAAPMMERFRRRKINDLLNAFFVPVVFLGKTLRLPPGKPQQHNVMFITATNRFFMFDPAMIRPGRFGIVVEFVNPDEDERADVAQHYIKIWHKKGYYQDDLIRPERIQEFAQATPNTSPAEIEQMIEEAVDIRVQHVAELRRLKAIVEDPEKKKLLDNDKNYEKDRKHWLRFRDNIYDNSGNEISDWEDERVDWHALMETRSVISFGRGNPGAVNETTRRKVAFHELGHFIALKAFNGNRIKPTLLTVIPRRGSLGMVAHVPFDTREQHPQEYYEGLVRTAVASWVAERYFFGQNLPGVAGDLNNATNNSALMVGKWGMSNFECSDEDREYYANIGNALISEPEMSMFSPQADAFLTSVLKSPDTRKDVATIIGMAAIDAYRLIRFPQNRKIFLEVIPEFLKLDEFAGGKLEDLWKKLDEELVPLSEMPEADQKVFPVNSFAAQNSFYGKASAEGSDIYEQVVALTTEESVA